MNCFFCGKKLKPDGPFKDFDFPEWEWVVSCHCYPIFVDLKGLGDTKKEALEDYKEHENVLREWVKNAVSRS